MKMLQPPLESSVHTPPRNYTTDKKYISYDPPCNNNEPFNNFECNKNNGDNLKSVASSVTRSSTTSEPRAKKTRLLLPLRKNIPHTSTLFSAQKSSGSKNVTNSIWGPTRAAAAAAVGKVTGSAAVPCVAVPAPNIAPPPAPTSVGTVNNNIDISGDINPPERKEESEKESEKKSSNQQRSPDLLNPLQPNSSTSTTIPLNYTNNRGHNHSSTITPEIEERKYYYNSNNRSYITSHMDNIANVEQKLCDAGRLIGDQEEYKRHAYTNLKNGKGKNPYTHLNNKAAPIDYFERKESGTNQQKGKLSRPKPIASKLSNNDDNNVAANYYSKLDSNNSTQNNNVLDQQQIDEIKQIQPNQSNPMETNVDNTVAYNNFIQKILQFYGIDTQQCEGILDHQYLYNQFITLCNENNNNKQFNQSNPMTITTTTSPKQKQTKVVYTSVGGNRNAQINVKDQLQYEGRRDQHSEFNQTINYSKLMETGKSAIHNYIQYSQNSPNNFLSNVVGNSHTPHNSDSVYHNEASSSNYPAHNPDVFRKEADSIPEVKNVEQEHEGRSGQYYQQNTNHDSNPTDRQMRVDLQQMNNIPRDSSAFALQEQHQQQQQQKKPQNITVAMQSPSPPLRQRQYMEENDANDQSGSDDEDYTYYHLAQCKGGKVMKEKWFIHLKDNQICPIASPDDSHDYGSTDQMVNSIHIQPPGSFMFQENQYYEELEPPKHSASMMRNSEESFSDASSLDQESSHEYFKHNDTIKNRYHNATTEQGPSSKPQQPQHLDFGVALLLNLSASMSNIR